MGVVVIDGKETLSNPVLAMTNQIAIALTIHELAEKINDVSLRNQMQESAAKSIAVTSEKMTCKK